MTIDSDTEDIPNENLPPKTKDDSLNPNFTFDLSGDPYSDLLEVHKDGPDILKGTKPVRICLVFRRCRQCSMKTLGTNIC